MHVTTLVALSLLGASAALAQAPSGSPASGASSAQSQGQEAVTRPNTDTMQRGNPQPGSNPADVRLEAGANSFTEGQVRSRLEDAGFQNVSELRKDDQGIWRAKATQNGRQVTVGFDFKGNVAITQ